MESEEFLKNSGQRQRSRWGSFLAAILLSSCLLSIVLVFLSDEQTSASAALDVPAPTPTLQSPMFSLPQPDSPRSPQKSFDSGVRGVYRNYVAPGRGYSLKGMTAEYYDKKWLNGALVASEIITTAIDFELWCSAPPFDQCKLHPALTNGGAYSARWSGYLIIPESGQYTFAATEVDDSMRLFLDGAMILKSFWNAIPDDTRSATLWLEEGAHVIEIDYTQNYQYAAILRLEWSGPGFDTEIIPAERFQGCNSTSDCCLNSACCAGHEVGGEINTQSGVHNYTATDLRIGGIGEGLVFRRTYASSMADVDVAGLGYGWTHNYALRLNLPPIGPTVYVDAILGRDYPFCGGGSGAQACRTINYAVGQAEEGDTVQVAAGTYTEAITLRPGVMIQGAPGHTSVLNGAGALGPLVIGGGNAITATAVLSGFKLLNANNAYGNGGAIALTGASPQIINNVIMSNTAGFGGGVYLSNSEAMLSNNVLVSNTAGFGGGVYLSNSEAMLSNNVLVSNIAGFGGGGYLSNSEATLINHVIAHNQANTAGSGLYIQNASPHLLHSTIARNSGGDGSGLHITGMGANASTVALTNTILVSHTVGVTITEGSTVTLDATLWGAEGWGNTTDWGGAGVIITKTNESSEWEYNFWAVPLFADADAADYHLEYGSGGVDLGVETAVDFDIDGQPRQWDLYGPPDLGADECDSCQSTPSAALMSAERYNTTAMPWRDQSLVGGDSGSEVGSVMFRTADGTALRLLLHPDGQLEPYPGVRVTAGWEGVYPDITYVITQANQYVYRFDRKGRPLQSVDPHGNVISFTHNTTGQLVSVTDVGSGRSLEFHYDADGHLRDVIDPQLERDVQFDYNERAELTAVADTGGFVWTYTYADVGEGGTVISHLLSEVIDPLGNLVEYTIYDEKGRATQQFNAFQNTVSIVYDDLYTIYHDVSDNLYTDYYNARGAWAGQVGPDGSTVTRQYDDNFNLIAVSDQNGNVTSMAWNACGCAVERVTDALGNTTHMIYDATNHPTRITDARGNVTTYAYDGNLLITTTDALSGAVVNTYNDANLLIRTVAHGITTTYAYDEWGQRTAMTDAAGLMTTYGYDAVGRLITTTTSAGLVTVNEYDAGDNLIRVTRNYTIAGGPNYLGVYNQITEYGYDAIGRRVAMTDTLGAVTRSEYDAAGRWVRSIRNVLPGYPQNWQDTYNLVAEYGYDAAGRQALVTDTLGHVTYTEYDALGRVARTWQNYLPGYPQNHQNTYNTTMAHYSYSLEELCR